MNGKTESKAYSKFCILFLCVLFIGLPLVMHNGYFNISATKSLFFLAVGTLFAGISAITALFYIIRKRKSPLIFAPLDFSLIAFAAMTVLSAALSEYYLDVWLGRNSRFQGALVILLYVIIYISISNGLPKVDTSWLPIRVSAIVFTVVALIAIFHAFDVSPGNLFDRIIEKQRIQFISTIGNINFFSAYVCLCLPAFLICAVEEVGLRNNILWAVVLTLSGPAAVLTGSEGFVVGFAAFIAVSPFFLIDNKRRFVRFFAFLSLVLASGAVFCNVYLLIPGHVYEPAALMRVLLSPIPALFLISSLLAVCFFAKKRENFRDGFRKVYLGLIIAAVLLIISLFVYTNLRPGSLLDRFFLLDDYWGSKRILIWKTCIECMSDFSLKDILFGVGPESLQNLMEARGITVIDQAHNEYLQTLISTGIFGLLAQISVIALTAIAAIRSRKQSLLSVALFLGLAAYYAQAVFNIAQGFTSPIVYTYIAVIGSEYRHATFKLKFSKEKISYGKQTSRSA